MFVRRVRPTNRPMSCSSPVMMVTAQMRLRSSAIATSCASVGEMSWSDRARASVRRTPAREAASTVSGA